MPNPSARLTLHERDLRRIALLAGLYLIAPVQALSLSQDPDLFWHLRVGEWIVDHRAVPFEDHFSSYGAGRSWFAYSWLFEVIVYFLHRAFGLSGIVWFTAGMGVLITLAAHRLVRFAHLPMAAEVGLVALAMAAIKPMISPRPWLFTILFFAIQLILICRARLEDRRQGLWLMPLIFLFWSNLHIQFVYGMAALVLLSLESLVLSKGRPWILRAAPDGLSSKLVIGITLCSFAAVLATPYHFRIFNPVLDYAGQTGAFENIQELHPMFFRSVDHWIVLLLTLTAAFLLGWRRSTMPFPVLLLLMGVVLGFRARRDVWLVVLAAVWIIAEHSRAFFSRASWALSRASRVAVAIVVGLSSYGIAHWRGITERQLESAVAREYPVGAISYIRANDLSGPLFNTLDWGGFLIWSLREIPVAIDGRTNLHGEERVEKFVRIWHGAPGWGRDPDLADARLILADHHRPLTWLLRRDPRFRIAYEDDTAVVFVRSDREPIDQPWPGRRTS